MASRSSHSTTTPLSIYEALSDPLPTLKVEQGWVERSDTHYSSVRTELIHPPAVWIEVPMDTYVQKADRFMNNTAMQYLYRHTDPGPDPLARMRSEADVVRYGDEQLVFHVNHGLYACFGKGIFESYSEYEFDNSRPDKVWKLAGTSKKTIAVFESKIKSTIKWNEIQRAKLKPEESLRAKIRDAEDLEKATHFSGKSLKIMSQATRYARNATFNTNYVALFDADYLFLCVFDRTNPYVMSGTLVPCFQDNARKALLGWLIAAYEAERAGTNGRIPRHPDDDSGANHQTRSRTAQQPPDAPRGGRNPPPAGQGFGFTGAYDASNYPSGSSMVLPDRRRR